MLPSGWFFSQSYAVKWCVHEFQLRGAIIAHIRAGRRVYRKTFGQEDDGTLRQWAEVDCVP
jgi:hypothetical protein